MNREFILVLDFGSVYTELLAQRVRENHLFSTIVPYNISAKAIQLQKPKGIIFSSGAQTLSGSKKAPLPDKNIFKLNIPILGIGYGAEIIVKHFGGQVKSTKPPDLQRCELFIDDPRNLFWQMPNNITCWMNYAICIKRLPRDFKKVAHTQNNSFAAVTCLSKKIFGIAFHPEVVATQRGSQLIGNFLYKICGCIGTWTMDSYIRETISEIKKTVGSDKAVINLTATLDSSVTALLINKAIKKRLKCIVIDDGLLRKDEVKQLKNFFIRNFNLNLSSVDRSQRFIHGLKGVTDAGKKRNVINNLFIKIFQEQMKKVKGVKFLGEGMLYSRINKPAAGNSPFKLKLLQPLKNLFKEEVKVLAKELGIPDNIIFRQPFPREGLAVRIIGEVNPLRLRLLREVQSLLTEEIKSAGIYEEIWQSFAILLPVKNVVVVRCIASTDGITAEWVRLPYGLLDSISRRILSKIKGISRVVYDISSQPPVPIEWE